MSRFRRCIERGRLCIMRIRSRLHFWCVSASHGFGASLLIIGQIEQGELDRVVPKEQADLIVKTIKDNGGRADYLLFKDEAHGWRKAENIKAALEKELAFYEGIFGLNKGT